MRRKMNLGAKDAADGRARGRWLTGGLGAAGAVLVFTFAGLVELPDLPRRGIAAGASGEFRAPGLVLTRAETTRAEDVLGERLRLFDPTPLFLPVARDGFAPRAEAVRDSGDGQVAREFAARLSYDEGRELTSILRPASPSVPAAAAGLAAPRWFEGLARTAADGVPGPLPTPAARVKFFQVGTGELVLDKAFDLDSTLADGGWRPMRLMVLVNEVGGLGAPSIIAGSGVDEVDERIRGLAGREWVPASRLRPGIYRLEIGL